MYQDRRCYNNLNNMICAYIKMERYEEPITSKAKSRETIIRRSRSPMRSRSP